MISYEFWDSLGITIAAGKALPLVLVASARFALRGESREPRFWGAPHTELMKHYRHRMMVLYALGLTPPTAALRQTGPWAFKPHLEIDEELRSYHDRTLGLLESIFLRNGCEVIDYQLTNLEGMPYPGLRFDVAHMTGSCRMANRREEGVIDSSGEVFGHPGLFVTDGAAIPSSLGVNPALTILANAERVASILTERYGR
jgi:choline dehydrogenase-like flavoprotein